MLTFDRLNKKNYVVLHYFSKDMSWFKYLGILAFSLVFDKVNYKNEIQILSMTYVVIKIEK